MIKLIGVYDYTVLLTYIGLACTLFGMTQATSGNFEAAIVCLAISGACDAFDGRVARSKKNRTDDERNFGIQLDSLCDVICFGVFPGMICYLLGVRGLLGIPIVCFFCLGAVIRLAFFNVLEGNRQKSEGGCSKGYRGLPVTSVAFILPMFFCLRYFLPENAFVVLLHILLLTVGFLFILDFPLPKPQLKHILILMGIVAVTIQVVFMLTKLRVPSESEADSQLGDTTFEVSYDTQNP